LCSETGACLPQTVRRTTRRSTSIHVQPHILPYFSPSLLDFASEPSYVFPTTRCVKLRGFSVATRPLCVTLACRQTQPNHNVQSTPLKSLARRPNHSRHLETWRMSCFSGAFSPQSNKACLHILQQAKD
jgi:hypothetical protein